MMRLFIGIGLPDDAKELLAAEVAGMNIDGQMTSIENYHITLAFLGAREEEQIPQIEQLLDNAAAKRAPIPLAVRGMGHFGKPENALLFAALAPSKPLYFLNAALRQLLKKAKEPFDTKPMMPHVTLARKVDVTDIDLEKPIPPITFTADRLTLFHSTRVEGELRYIPIYDAKFQK